MEIKHAVQMIGSLAQETRLTVFRLLVRQGTEGLAAGDIAAALDVPAPTLSFHLSQLAAAGLLTSTRQGRSILYSVDFSGVRSLFEYLMEDCCQGRSELCGVLHRENASACCSTEELESSK